MKNVSNWSFSGPYFPAFGLNTEIYYVNLFIQSKCRKIYFRKTRNIDNFYVMGRRTEDIDIHNLCKCSR